MKKTLKSIAFAVFISVPVLVLVQPDTLQTLTAHYKAKAIALRMVEDLQLTVAPTTPTEQLVLARLHNLKLVNSTDVIQFQCINDKALPKLAAILTKRSE